MNGNRRLIVCLIGAVALTLSAGGILLAAQGRDLPPGAWAVLGSAVGALAGLLPPSPP